MIAISNMEMPKGCYNYCEFIAMEEVGCPLKDYVESHQYKNEIHPDCPLIEIVRCGECKYSKEWYGDHRLCYLWSETGVGVFEDGFCSYGKRRE